MAALLSGYSFSPVEHLVIVKHLLDLLNELLHVVVLVAVQSLLYNVEINWVLDHLVVVNQVCLVEVYRLSKDLCVFDSQNFR